MSFIWILLSIFFATCASMFNKKAALLGKGGGILASLLTPWYLDALVCLVLLACAWIMALRYHPLSFAYPFMSSVRGFVLFGAWYIFHERVYTHEIVGMGILMFSRKIVVLHYAGVACAMDEIRDIADTHGLSVENSFNRCRMRCDRG